MTFSFFFFLQHCQSHIDTVMHYTLYPYFFCLALFAPKTLQFIAILYNIHLLLILPNSPPVLCPIQRWLVKFKSGKSRFFAPSLLSSSVLINTLQVFHNFQIFQYQKPFFLPFQFATFITSNSFVH